MNRAGSSQRICQLEYQLYLVVVKVAVSRCDIKDPVRGQSSHIDGQTDKRENHLPIKDIFKVLFEF